jgi:transketolase
MEKQNPGRPYDPENLKIICNEVRKDILRMVYAAGSGHIGGSLSATELLTVLYFKYLKYDAQNPNWSERDRFILSKGHCTPLYYSILARSGYFGLDELTNFRKINSPLQGHPDKLRMPIVETSSGSLGQGLSIAAGIAFGLRLDKNPAKVYCMLGDGELDEGQIWESLATIKKYQLNNLITIIDNNNIQLDGRNEDVKNLEPLREKLVAFNYYVLEVDGHNIEEIIKTFDEAIKLSDSGNNVIILGHTIKGKGVSFMENTAEWHGKAPNKEQYEVALKELE